MLTIEVWYENDIGEMGKKEIINLRPRTYMVGWSFEKLLKYIKEECEWQNIDINKIEEIILHNKKEQWQVIIGKEEN